MRFLRKAGEGGGHEPPQGDDGELLARSLREPAAFEGLVARHSTALHGYLARRAPAAADDLLSEVWLRAFAGRSGYDPERGTVRGWLFGVARHVLATHWRAAETAGPLGPEPVADPWHAVDQRLDAAAVAPLIRRTLAALPHAERELLLLVVWEQLTPAEAAAVVGVPQGTARSRLHRARTRLREALDQPSPTSLTGESA
ncbi:RNA polymerase sigma-70 factor, ECF subfamily [Actinacidiphila yanglinensis]|uniref:RNA polymerase sigma-70 factor, ECF subfamily n=1 Tax=Actinacidiphila yanglinensis TaxID=310779 RepID=A0A1H5VQV4_9ACTN|nr:sigma-70 family RNA polymerase sigma factor [Actinacidiphila yanglinensis]SEF89662.1 RNA polymerase sigma-70 factor, ECF subfamily [Actinacidiphila yanglinensis]